MVTFKVITTSTAPAYPLYPIPFSKTLTADLLHFLITTCPFLQACHLSSSELESLLLSSNNFWHKSKITDHISPLISIPKPLKILLLTTVLEISHRRVHWTHLASLSVFLLLVVTETPHVAGSCSSLLGPFTPDLKNFWSSLHSPCWHHTQMT